MHRADEPPLDPQRAFTDWATAEVGALVRLGFALTHDEGAAEDLVETALARTLLEWPGFAVRGNPNHFARRVIVHELGSVRRRRRRAEAAVARIDLTTTPEFEADEAELAERDRIWREIVNVAPRPRAVLVLRFYEGRSEHEVAELLGSSVESVRADAADGLVTLRAGELLDALVSR